MTWVEMSSLKRWPVFFVAAFLIFTPETCNSYCRNMYQEGKIKIHIGRQAGVDPRNSRYNLESIVKFTCPTGYHFAETRWKYKKFVWIRCSNYGWTETWPTCRGQHENVTCFNEYAFTAKFNKSWLNETPNRKHALFKPVKFVYPHLTTLRFQCPKGMSFKGAKGLVIMQSTCGSNADWSWEWPMCKGQTCEPFRLVDGITGSEDRMFTPGFKIDISCWNGYHLWGSNTSECLPDLTWSGFPRECVKYSVYMRNCLKLGDHFEEHNYKPHCRKRVRNYRDEDEQAEKTKRIALGTAVPLSALFVIFLTLSSLYVRRLRRRHRMMTIAIRYQNEDHTLQMVLPSYEEAEKNKPTTPPPTFEESLDTNTFIHRGHVSTSSEQGESLTSHLPPSSPPVYEE